MSSLNASNAARYGRTINDNGGAYINGHTYPLETRLMVAQVESVPRGGTACLGCTHARTLLLLHDVLARVSEHYVRGVECELLEHGHVLDPEEKKNDKIQPYSGPGSRTI